MLARYRAHAHEYNFRNWTIRLYDVHDMVNGVYSNQIKSIGWSTTHSMRTRSIVKSFTTFYWNEYWRETVSGQKNRLWYTESSDRAGGGGGREVAESKWAQYGFWLTEQITNYYLLTVKWDECGVTNIKTSNTCVAASANEVFSLCVCVCVCAYMMRSVLCVGNAAATVGLIRYLNHWHKNLWHSLALIFGSLHGDASIQIKPKMVHLATDWNAR